MHGTNIYIKHNVGQVTDSRSHREPRTGREAQPGHPMSLYRPQGHGRLDNPSRFQTWYFATAPEATVGETFADLAGWSDARFTHPRQPDARQAPSTFRIDETTPILDLDDAQTLLDRGLRPTQVVERNRAVTQTWAALVFDERDRTGSRRWAGVRWWSFHRPHRTVIALWYQPGQPLVHMCVATVPLTTDHAAVRDAAATLGKPLR